ALASRARTPPGSWAKGCGRWDCPSRHSGPSPYLIVWRSHRRSEGVCSVLVHKPTEGTTPVRTCFTAASNTIQINDLSASSRGINFAISRPRPALRSRSFTKSEHPNPSGEIYGSKRRVQDNQGERGQIRRPAVYRYQGQGAARHCAVEGLQRCEVHGRP